MSETEPIIFRPRAAGASYNQIAFGSPGRETRPFTTFNRQEIAEILAVYGRKVAAGEWRDYAIDISRDTAVFAVYRRASVFPLYRIEKSPRHARRQGAYSVVTASGLILKRGNDLSRVLKVLEKPVQVVSHSRAP